MLNNNQLSNSDFLTGAFPAQYGNARDFLIHCEMEQRKFEYLLQMGTENLKSVEDNFPKTDPQFMVSYRYAFLDFFDKIGLFRHSSIPKYQDLTFKSDFDFGKTSLSL